MNSTLENKKLQMQKLTNKIFKLRTLATNLEEERRKLKVEVDKLEREETKKDGRYKVIKPRERQVNNPKLTKDDIYSLAAKLGISL